MKPAVDDAVLAAELARAAGAALLQLRTGGRTGQDLKDAADAAAQVVLADLLARHRPDDAVLSEEAVDDPARLAARRVWIIDPLDGTREYGERDRDDWAVHVALWAGGDLVAGAVALPARDVVYDTADPAGGAAGPRRGAAAGGQPHPARRPSSPRWPSGSAGPLVPMGSAGVKCAAVWRGEADAYVHAGGQYEWDSAAPVAVARAAGLHTSRIDGSPLRVQPGRPHACPTCSCAGPSVPMRC